MASSGASVFALSLERGPPSPLSPHSGLFLQVPNASTERPTRKRSLCKFNARWRRKTAMCPREEEFRVELPLILAFARAILSSAVSPAISYSQCCCPLSLRVNSRSSVPSMNSFVVQIDCLDTAFSVPVILSAFDIAMDHRRSVSASSRSVRVPSSGAEHEQVNQTSVRSVKHNDDDTH